MIIIMHRATLHGLKTVVFDRAHLASFVLRIFSVGAETRKHAQNQEINPDIRGFAISARNFLRCWKLFQLWRATNFCPGFLVFYP